jgi:hypothetical protein
MRMKAGKDNSYGVGVLATMVRTPHEGRTPTLESAIITLALGVALVKSKNPEVGPMGIF